MVDSNDDSKDRKEGNIDSDKDSSIIPPEIPSENQSTKISPASTNQDSTMIGDYRIIRKIGRGGMGVVYEAEQKQPKRLVALKVIHGGRFIDEYQIKLFAREAQALGRLNHPGIASIYESGRTPDGHHFFAMELVRGETLKEYLERVSNSGPLTPSQLRERLAIFKKISDAVTYAHQRGIIHRDLKPSNIIVQRNFEPSHTPGEPESPGIKILDFGLARITEIDIAVATIHTEVGMIQGTLPYMSPEQIRGNPDEIDVRSDVYSLGVILYEMIAGHRPYDVHQAVIHEAARVICETPPAPISKTWSGTKKLDRDIETIVGKALEKTAERRYQNVSALGDDISRFLLKQPISARPPSTIYQLHKLFLRHKVGFGFVISIVVLIVVFSITSMIQSKRIAGERDRANREASRANLEASSATQVAEFLTGLFRVSDPAEGRGREITAREVLDKGAAKIESELTHDPILQARLLFTMGDVYRNLGLLDRAEQLLEQSVSIRLQKLGPEAPDTLRASSLLGVVYDLKGKTELAEKMLASVLEKERRVLGENNSNTLKTLANLANLYDSQGRYDKSFSMMQDVLKRRKKVLGALHMDTLGSEYNLAVALYRQHDLPEAARLLTEVASSFSNVNGPDHPHTLVTKDLLAEIYKEMNNLEDSRLIREEVYETRLRVLGSGHMDTLATKLGLANIMRLEKRYAEAEAMFREILSEQTQILGSDHSDIFATQSSLATMLSDTGRFDEAERLWRDILPKMKRTLGYNHPFTAECYEGLAIIEMHHGHHDEALGLLRSAVSANPLKGTEIADNSAFTPLKGKPEFENILATTGRKQ